MKTIPATFARVSLPTAGLLFEDRPLGNPPVVVPVPPSAPAGGMDSRGGGDRYFTRLRATPETLALPPRSPFNRMRG